ncbi:competence/damage-inducible protein A [Anaerosalibacter sp. Marseille-P3206]|uniref:competence/damage-inducible protein A n=1 Tax=Anaerosalibacter sp. Marseille-P3206 TaxID=1871005 RepID=UPI00098599FB|nr:competence/damage-inducible protein A [Anaerosalibacter sp. Marseille-P3206]
MKAEIISVGTELLLGNTINTDAQFLSQRCADLGIDVYYHTVVGDNIERIKEVTEIAINRSNLIIFTGGLGPTSDDITKEVVSELLNIQLELNQFYLKEIEKYFKNINKQMTENNIKQAYLPKGSIVLKNDVGTAPGAFLSSNGVKVIFLPGPPIELKTMFNRYVVPLLDNEYIIKSKVIKTIGIGESQIDDMLDSLIKIQTNPTIATYAKEGQVDIRITAKGKDEDNIDLLIDELTNKVSKIIGDYIYSYNNESVEEVFYSLLKKKSMKVAFCESCTGGLITSRFTRIPGVSEVFDRGLVTYSNEAKINELGVKEETLKTYGAVSQQTAIEMVEGLFKKSNVDIAISTTGIAGPSSDDKNKPIGLVYIGVADKDKSFAIECHFSGNRESIQKKATNYAFNEGRKFLLR